MKTKVKALTSFMHGRVHAHLGDEIEVTKGEADELVNAGLVQIAGAPAAAVEEPAKDPAVEEVTDPDDLVGGHQKMDDAPENKMEAEPENKGAGKPKTAKAK